MLSPHWRCAYNTRKAFERSFQHRMRQGFFAGVYHSACERLDGDPTCELRCNVVDDLFRQAWEVELRDDPIENRVHQS